MLFLLLLGLPVDSRESRRNETILFSRVVTAHSQDQEVVSTVVTTRQQTAKYCSNIGDWSSDNEQRSRIQTKNSGFIIVVAIGNESGSRRIYDALVGRFWQLKLLLTEILPTSAP